MAVALRGNLEDFGIAEVFQLIGQQRKTGTLEISHEGEEMQLHFDQGAVVSAAPVGAYEGAALGEMLVRCGLITRERLRELEEERPATAWDLVTLLVDTQTLSAEAIAEIEDLLTRDTIFSVLRWSKGAFRFTAGDVRHDKPPEDLLAAEQILMDGLRMVDEWRTFAQHVASDDAVFQRTGRFETYRETATGETQRRLPVAEAVFLLVDGRLTVRRIIDLSRLGSFDGMRVLAELRSAGVIQPIDPVGARRVPRKRAPRRELRVWARVAAGVASVIPVLLLMLLAALAYRPVPAPLADPSYPIVRKPLGDVQRSFHQRRVRHALDVYRFSRGAWPARLEDLVDEGLLSVEELAPPHSDAYYYYARRGAGMVLLTPRL